jgi:hypothetical protein
MPQSKTRKAFARKMRPYKYQLIHERPEGDVDAYVDKENRLLYGKMKELWGLLQCDTKPIMIPAFLLRIKVFIKSNCPLYAKRLK